jgi:predicted amidohydrolase
MKTKWFIILATLLSILGCSCCLASTISKSEASFQNGSELSKSENSVLKQNAPSEIRKEHLKTKGNNIMKIALCHLEVSCGPQDKNLEKIERAVKIASKHGARLVATPETAVQGYYFHRIDETRQLEVQPADYLDSLRKTVKEEQVYLLLGCGEYVPETGLHHNSCLVFAPDGGLQSRHRKIYGEKLGSEKWASPGEKVSTTICDGVKVGVLVCADSWFDERPASLKEQGAEIIIDIAAWPETPETGNPIPSWIKVNRNTGIPFVVNNQTGKTKWMDMSIGESVLIQDEEVICKYSGGEAVLLFDFDVTSKKILSKKFEVIKL